MVVDIIGCGRSRILDMSYCEDCVESPETKGCTERRRMFGVGFITSFTATNRPLHTYTCPVCGKKIVRDEPFFQYKLYACPHCGNLISIGEDGILR